MSYFPRCLMRYLSGLIVKKDQITDEYKLHDDENISLFDWEDIKELKCKCTSRIINVKRLDNHLWVNREPRNWKRDKNGCDCSSYIFFYRNWKWIGGKLDFVNTDCPVISLEKINDLLQKIKTTPIDEEYFIYFEIKNDSTERTDAKKFKW